ncbi:MAG: galactose-1-phosphate uridylyltransferase [Deltaproteobacteria bacterium]|nr:galactose-1-phosphate uridylyltransferase [Deltaproteobacteria bacterium]
MSELRLNVVTKEWVIIAPGRATRPKDFKSRPSRPPLAAHDPDCPFCPGNEHLTTEESFRLPAALDAGWQTRVVPNRFPVLSRDQTNPAPRHDGLKHAVDGFGVHDVIIETPRHDLTTALMPPSQVEAILRTYRNRYQVCQADPRLGHILLFKNHGPAAGTSLVHPHSQVVATSVVSYQVRDRIRTLEDHQALYGHCVLCKMVDDEIAEGVRIVHLNESFVALVPYAALSSYHIWIFPRRHMGSYGEINDVEVANLAASLRAVLRKLYFGLNDPDFNYVIRSSPRTCSNGEFHWYLSIVPRLARAAGFELGSGMYVNDSYPEDSAAFLRSVQVPDG